MSLTSFEQPAVSKPLKMMKATRNDVAKYPDMSLYQEIILLQNFFIGKWVVENVRPYYAPLIPQHRPTEGTFLEQF